MVGAAGAGAGPEARGALADLFAIYWSPLYAFVLRRGYPADEARDLTQGFFTRLLEKNDLAAADPQKGRFRSWLLTALKHYLANEWDRDRARKRGGDLVRVDFDDAADLVGQQPAPELSPERAYDRQWTLALLERVMAKLREEYARKGKGDLFERLKESITGDDATPYAAIAVESGLTENAVKQEAFRLRRRFRQLLHAEISETLTNPGDVEDEVRFLFSALHDE
jgi:RNA polymerase sigma-70 factor (ECF subfamily)